LRAAWAAIAGAMAMIAAGIHNAIEKFLYQ
jgi:hypothetical protein